MPDKSNRSLSSLFRSGNGIIMILGVFTALMGVVNLLSAIQPALQERLVILEQLLPLEVRQGSRLAAALAGFALLVLAVNISRRKTVAWAMTITVLVLSMVSHLLKGLDYEEASLSAAMVILLLIARPLFIARSDTPSIRNGLIVLAGALLFTLVYGTAGFFLLDRHFQVAFELPVALRQTVLMFTQFSNPGLEPVTGHGRFFADSIYVIAGFTLLYSLIMLVRPVLVRQPATEDERSRAKTIIEKYGRTPLARVAMLDDKSFFFSSGGTVVAYVPKGRIALVLGDPMGPEGDIIACIREFRDFCAKNDWQAVFSSTLPHYLKIYKDYGFSALTIGQEAIVDLSAFTLEGSENKGIRYAYNRLVRKGFRAEVHLPPLDGRLLRALRNISNEWLTMRHGREMRFGTGWFDDAYIRSTPVMTVRSEDGRITAFANLVPEYQANETSIDLMRHRVEAEHGTMEFIFASMFQWAKEQGYATFSLGLSALSGTGERSDDPAVDRAIHYLFEHLNRFYNFKGLHEFKEKFHPDWQPRYLIYPGAASLPSVVTAIVRANTGDDFFSVYFPPKSATSPQKMGRNPGRQY